MLVYLHIKNIALIEDLNLELGKNLNIFTGETGAGKSIIIDSINAILGSRVSKELIRTGEEKALIEAEYSGEFLKNIFKEFNLDEEDDEILIISREVFLSGRNICKVNGKLVTVSTLKKIGEKLIDVHGQYDNQSLLRTESHIELLDLFAGVKLLKLKKLYKEKREDYLKIKNNLKKLTENIGEREKKIDILKYQIDEIDIANLSIGEDDNLQNEKSVLNNAEKITYVLSKVYESLISGNNQKSSARDLINDSITSMKTIAEYDYKYDKLTKDIENLEYLIDDINDIVRDEKDIVEYNPNLLEEIQERIELINTLKRKYGNTIEEILVYKENAIIELNTLENVEENTSNLKMKIDKLEIELLEYAKKINIQRCKAGDFLAENIKKELIDLEIKNANFKVDIEYELNENNFKETGLDKIEFLISTNKGEPLKSLSKIASGGEMARIMLAIKKTLATVDKIETLIFDEIDTGISGIAAQKVGKKLKQISKNHQVICVTHLPQIATLADNHYYIEKISDKNTYTKIKNINYDEKIIEISRLLAGDNSEFTTKLAKEMLDKAEKYK
ncbi:MAG: DNA repair protein RecN [Clostridiales bacterium]